jgi:hypothetical protein
LQAFLSDPILKDEYLLQIELLKTFRRISTRVNSKFREELILPYLAILTMQIRNVINDNEYEFSLASFTSSLKSLNQQQASPKSVKSASFSTTNSNYQRDMLLQHQQSIQQQDIQIICALVFNIYQKLCLSTSNDTSITFISRQSIKESLIPGLINLREIFQHHIIQNISNGNHQNEFVAQLDLIMNKLEHSHLTSESTPLASPNVTHNSNSHIYTTPVTTTTTITITPNHNHDTIALSQKTASNLSSNINKESSFESLSVNNTISGQPNNNGQPVQGVINQNGMLDGNSNFKSFVFKGIASFKDNSKDKFSNFLSTNKTFRK